MVFENKQASNWQLAISQKTQPLPFCDPLPTGQLEAEKRAEIGPDSTAEKHKKRLRPLGRPFDRIALRLLFSTKRYGGVGAWLRDAGRGPQEIAKIAKIAKRRRN